MKKTVFNQFEKINSADFNTLQDYLYKDFQDSILYGFFKNVNGFIGTSFAPVLTNATTITLSSGRGFYYDSSHSGNTPKYSAIHSDTSVIATITAPHATLNRIDLICLAPATTTTTEDRYLKTGGTGPITLVAVNKSQVSSYTLSVVAGTASGSPAVPSLPAGYVPVAQVTVTAAVGATAVTDVRTKLVGATFNDLSPNTTLGDITYHTGTTNARLPGNTTTVKKYLSSSGNGTISSAPVYAQPDFSELSGTATIEQGGTDATTAAEGFDNLAPTTTKGDLVYHTGTTNARLPGNTTTTKKFLSSTGNGTIADNPSYLPFIAPTVQKFLTATSGTYTSPADCLYIRVRISGGGGGGAGSTGNGGYGAASTFGASLLSANGGAGAGIGGAGAVGGTATLGTGPVGLALSGGSGGGAGGSNVAGVYASGGAGGNNALGGGAGSTQGGQGGAAGATNTGGGGAGHGSPTGGNAGAGGGAGGYIDAIIYNPAATYAYVVGGGGTGGTGSSGLVGGAGGSGVLIVEEYYQ